MKRFRFSTIHFVMIGVILFGLVALVHRFFPIGASTVFALLISLLVLIALFIYQKHSYEFSELEQIEYLNNQANSGLMMLLDKMPVGVIKVRPDSNQVEWFNPFAELIFAQENGEFDQKNYVKLLTLVWMRSEFMQTFQARDTLLTLILIKGYFTFLMRRQSIQRQIV